MDNLALSSVNSAFLRCNFAAMYIFLKTCVCLRQLDGAVGDQLFQVELSLMQADFRQLSFGDVLQGFDGADYAASRVAQRCRGSGQPAPLFAELREKTLAFDSAGNQKRASGIFVVIAIDFSLDDTVDDQIGQHWPRFGVKRPPLIAGSDHLRGRFPGHVLACLVPMRDDMLIIDDERGDGIAVGKFQGLQEFGVRKVAHSHACIVKRILLASSNCTSISL
jgi:hypothetical protein